MHAGQFCWKERKMLREAKKRRTVMLREQSSMRISSLRSEQGSLLCDAIHQIFTEFVQVGSNRCGVGAGRMEEAEP